MPRLLCPDRQAVVLHDLLQSVNIARNMIPGYIRDTKASVKLMNVDMHRAVPYRSEQGIEIFYIVSISRGMYLPCVIEEKGIEALCCEAFKYLDYPSVAQPAPDELFQIVIYISLKSANILMKLLT